MKALNEILYFDKEKYIIQDKGLFSLLISKYYFKWIRTTSTGKEILLNLDGIQTLEDIANKMSKKYNIPIEIIARDIVEFCIDAEKDGLITTYPEKPHNLSVDSEHRHVYFNITNYCNKNCLYCNVNICNDINTSAFMPITVIEEYIHTLFPTGKCSNSIIYLSGGEPFFHKDIFNIIELINTYDAQVVIYSNGSSITQTIAEKLSQYKKTVIFLSIDSASESINDSIRGKNSFKDVVNTSELLDKYGVIFFYAMTLSKYNIENLSQMITFAQKNKAMGIFLNEPIFFNDNAENLKKHFDFSYDEFNNAIIDFAKKVHIINSWRNKSGNTRSTLRFIRENNLCLNNIHQIKNKKNCSAGINKLSIDIDGTIFPCNTLRIKKYKMEFPNLIDSKPILLKYPECSNCDVEIFCIGGCKSEILFFSGQLENFYQQYCKMRQTNIKKALWAPVMLTDEIND